MGTCLRKKYESIVDRTSEVPTPTIPHARPRRDDAHALLPEADRVRLFADDKQLSQRGTSSVRTNLPWGKATHLLFSL